MKRLFLILFCTLFLPAAAGKTVYGWLEYAFIGKGEYRLKAKLDSGAKTSSIHVYDMELIKGQDGRAKVRFKIRGSVEEESTRYWKKIIMTKEIHRTVKVKSSNGDVSERVSVLLPMRIGKKSLETEFTLSDREDMNYAILLGRNTVSELGLIDCSKSFIVPK